METSIPFSKFTASSLEKYFVQDAQERYSQLFGQPAYYAQPYPYPVFSDIAAPVAAEASSAAFRDTTNTQINGVDEADLIETDGNYLYQANGNTLTVINVRDRAHLKVAFQTNIESLAQWGKTQPDKPPADSPFPITPYGGWNNIDGMYLQDNRLTVISSQSLIAATGHIAASTFLYPGPVSSPQVQVTVLDIADPSNVSILEVSTLEGSLISSRAIGDDVFVVTSNSWQLPAPEIIPASNINSTANSATTFPPIPNQGVSSDLAIASSLIAPYPPMPNGTYETEADYLNRIAGEVLDLGLPDVTTRDGLGNTIKSGNVHHPSAIYQPLNNSFTNQLYSIATFDVSDDHLGVDQITGIPTDWVRDIFVSEDYLYMLQNDFSSSAGNTKILQFDLDTSELIASGEVSGIIDSQFSVDEHDGYLRISTTNQAFTFGSESSNNVYILEQIGQNLEVIGELEGLAPGERIFSTRFQGDYGFMVTFRQVDPLFTLDLSDPTNPKVAGELKLPGFSEYLQVIEQGNKTLLLGVGRDADPLTGRAQALKVSLFDVTDLNHPIEIDSYIFDGDFSSSAALWDHKAITYIPDEQLLAIPTQEFFSGNRFTPSTSQAKLSVFNINGQTGIDILGEIEHGQDWINRSVRIRNELYAVSGKRVSSYAMPSLKPVGDIRWPWPLPTKSIDFLQWHTETVLSSNHSSTPATNEGLTIEPTPQSENIFSDRHDDLLNGGSGDDRIYGNGTADQLLGGAGNDEMYGASSDEWFDGGAGDDTLYLNGGADTVVLREGDGTDSIHGFTVGESKFGLANGLTFNDLSITPGNGFTRISFGSHQLARVNWVDATQLNEASNFITV